MKKMMIWMSLLGLLAMGMLVSFMPEIEKEPNPKDYTETAFGMSMEMVYVKGGTFSMGATSEQGSDVMAHTDEGPIHEVTLDGFYIGRYEVTQAQWEAVMGTTLNSSASWIAGKGSGYPMYYVSWSDAREFCKRLSDRTGKNYVLPTEAQWEYAARGGNKSQHYMYAGSNDIYEVAWYEDISTGKTHLVGTKKANELGIYDMSGNVFEWCLDWYGNDYYRSSPVANPQGPTSGDYRVVRGGSWGYEAKYSRVSGRYGNKATDRNNVIGFRVVCGQKIRQEKEEKTFDSDYIETADYTEKAFSLNMKMVYVEGGEFEMGATSEQRNDAYVSETPGRSVTLDSYHIGKYAITQAQWKAVMGTEILKLEGDNLPKERVSWDDAQVFCRRLSERTGKQYVLPTEAQWEYAARGGNKSQHYKYAGGNDVDEVAWYKDISSDKTHHVGIKRANELGVYDMSGNVWEWCLDWYAGNYDENDTKNPSGPAEGSYRVVRGGSWSADSTHCRVSYRGGVTPGSRNRDLGFRVVCISK